MCETLSNDYETVHSQYYIHYKILQCSFLLVDIVIEFRSSIRVLSIQYTCCLKHTHNQTRSQWPPVQGRRLPPKKPYVSIMMFEFGENVDKMNATDPIMLPQMQAVRQPNLLEKALTIGPATNIWTNDYKRKKEINQLLIVFYSQVCVYNIVNNPKVHRKR